jgi:hypothetical protein
MNRRSILTISAVMAFGLGLLPGGAFAQQKALKEQIVGTWSITSVSTNTKMARRKLHLGPA